MTTFREIQINHQNQRLDVDDTFAFYTLPYRNSVEKFRKITSDETVEVGTIIFFANVPSDVSCMYLKGPSGWTIIGKSSLWSL